MWNKQPSFFFFPLTSKCIIRPIVQGYSVEIGFGLLCNGGYTTPSVTDTKEDPKHHPSLIHSIKQNDPRLTILRLQTPIHPQTQSYHVLLFY